MRKRKFMNQLLNIDDKALIIKDFLPTDLFKKINKFDFSKYNKELSKQSWQKSLFTDQYNNETQENIEAYDNIYLKNAVLADKTGRYLEKEKFDDYLLKEIADIVFLSPHIPTDRKKIGLIINYYEYKKYAGINWHNDKSHTLNFSLYIHDLWDENWGGETLIDTGRGLPLVSYPYSNTMLIIKNDVPHRVCPVVVDKTRKVLQGRIRYYE